MPGGSKAVMVHALLIGHIVSWRAIDIVVQPVLQIKVEAYPGEAKKKPAAQGKKKGAAAASKKQSADAGKKQGSEGNSDKKDSPKTQAA